MHLSEIRLHTEIRGMMLLSYAKTASFSGKYKYQTDPFQSYGRRRPPLLPAPRPSLDRFKPRFLRHRRMLSHMPTRPNPVPSAQGGLHLMHPFRIVLDILQSSARKSAILGLSLIH